MMSANINKYRGVGISAALILSSAAGRAATAPVQPPNILVIISDDLTQSELGCYGGRNVKTPNIDRLAGEGMHFTHAYVSMAMCTPCRTELYTGLYPMSSGVAWNHAFANPGTRSMCHYLGDLGYRVGLTGKTHIQPPKTFPFIKVPGFEPNCVAITADYNCDGIRDFMKSKPDQPFCLVVASVNSHMPWTVGDPSQFKLNELKLPPNFADTPEMRTDFSKYLAEIAVLDTQVGDVLRTLEETGQAGNTMVVFTSEQGAQFPFNKWTCWEQGMKTAFIVRWPGKVQAGSKSDALIQYADAAPTFIQAAGGNLSAVKLDGISFLDVLLKREEGQRKYVYGMHNNIPEGPAYPIRTIRSKDFRYIWNLTPDVEYFEKHIEKPSANEDVHWWESWKKATATDAHAMEMFNRYRRRPAEQLYKSDADPYEMTDLAGNPEYAAVKAELRKELEKWMGEQGDPGVSLDTQAAVDANRKAGAPAPKKKPQQPVE